MGFQVIWTKTADATFRQLETEAREAFENRQRTQKKKASNPHSAGSSRDKVVFLAGRAKKSKNMFVIGG